MNARFEMAECKCEPCIALTGIAGKVCYRHPYFNIRIERNFERRGHNADDAVRLAVENQTFCSQILISFEALLPHFLVDDSDFGCALPVFAFDKRSPDYGCNIEHFEKVRRDKRSTNAIRSLSSSQVDTLSLKHSQVFE